MFIPGNAGDYKQSRSIGSVSERGYLHRRLEGNRQLSQRELEEEAKQLSINRFDHFSIDYNEELSAINGIFLEDQTQFLNDCIRKILSLYDKNSKPGFVKPTSVILIGHSMGGVIARASFLAENYVSDSVITIITLNTPHYTCPLLIHKDIDYFYQKVNMFWRNAQEHEELHDVAIVSIGGGWRDIQVRADLSDLKNIVPNHQQISVISTSIPNVWLANDHLSCVWCNQLVVVVSSSLANILDPETKQATLPLDKRMQILTRTYESNLPYVMGFEQGDISTPCLKDTDPIVSTLKDIPTSPIAPIRLKNLSFAHFKAKWDLRNTQNRHVLQVFTTAPSDEWSVIACVEEYEQCVDFQNYEAIIPYKYHSGQKEFQWEVQRANIIHKALDNYKFIYITSKYDGKSKDQRDRVFVALMIDVQDPALELSSAFVGQDKVRLDSRRLMHNFTLSDINKFNAYSLYIKEACDTSSLFEPMIIQYAKGMKEEIFSTKKSVVKFHQQYERNETSVYYQGSYDAKILLIADPMCQSALITQYDWLSSFDVWIKTYASCIPGVVFIVLLIILRNHLNKYRVLKFSSTGRLLYQLLKSPDILVFSLLGANTGSIAKLLILIHPRLSQHSFSSMPYPWPSVMTMLGLFGISMCIIFLLTIIASVLFKITHSILKRPLSDKYFGVAIAVTLLGLTFSTHTFIPLLITVLWLLVPSNTKQKIRLENFEHTLFLFYFVVCVCLVAPSFVTWVKLLNISYQILDGYEVMCAVIIIHVALLKYTSPHLVRKDAMTTRMLYGTALLATYLSLFPTYRLSDITVITTVIMVGDHVKKLVRGSRPKK